ncbi:LamG-like jellyroll fold domain-containing protein [Planctomycetota bacterium]
MQWLNGDRVRLVLTGFVIAMGFVNGNVRADFTFGEPVNLGPTVNSSGVDYAPRISADGLELYFQSRNRPDSLGECDLYVAARATIDEDWGEPINLGPNINTPAFEGTPSISLDGLELYFCSEGHQGSFGNSDLWKSSRATKNDPWQPAVNLGSLVNTSASEAHPCISADGLTLYFNCTTWLGDGENARPGGFGDGDLWVTTRPTKDGAWSLPQNLGATINSPDMDFGPYISADGLLLFFMSNRPGGYGGNHGDTWMSRRNTQDDPWQKPIHIGRPINTSYNDGCGSISADGMIFYFLSGRFGGSGNWDMWQASILPVVDFTGDDKVDVDDLIILIEHWGTDYPLCDMGPMPWGDGVVNEADLEVFMRHWGQEVDDATLLAWWKLDETEGDVAYDSAATNDAIVTGGAMWQPIGGQVNGALLFDGIDDYIDTLFKLNPAESVFSVFAWVKGGAPGQVFLSQADGADWLMLDDQGCLKTTLKGLHFRARDLTSKAMIADDTWHCVGFTWDGKNRVLYVDDVEVARDLHGGLQSCEGDLYIGIGEDLVEGSFWEGMIDEVMIYDRVVVP